MHTQRTARNRRQCLQGRKNHGAYRPRSALQDEAARHKRGGLLSHVRSREKLTAPALPRNPSATSGTRTSRIRQMTLSPPCSYRSLGVRKFRTPRPLCCFLHRLSPPCPTLRTPCFSGKLQTKSISRSCSRKQRHVFWTGIGTSVLVERADVESPAETKFFVFENRNNFYLTY